MFIVLDNDKPAVLFNTGIWSNHKFDTFAEALEYAVNWLGPYSSTLNNADDCGKWEYSGYGDTIEIKKG